MNQPYLTGQDCFQSKGACKTIEKKHNCIHDIVERMQPLIDAQADLLETSVIHTICNRIETEFRRVKAKKSKTQPEKLELLYDILNKAREKESKPPMTEAEKKGVQKTVDFLMSNNLVKPVGFIRIFLQNAWVFFKSLVL